MNVYVILFSILCNYILSGQSQHNSEIQNSNEDYQSNIPEISEEENLKKKKVGEEESVDESDTDQDSDDENNDDDDDDDDDDDGDKSKEKSEPEREDLPPIPPQYQYELKAGNMADLFSTNEHKYVPLLYKEFGRRFLLKYPTNKRLSRADDVAEATLDQAVKKSLKDNDASNYVIPRKAPPEVVLEIAKKAALLEASKPHNPADDVTKRDILRSGAYWNGIWKEDVVIPKKVLRTKNKSLEEYTDVTPELETIRVKIMPGTKLHALVSLTKQISPRLLYIVNNKH